MKLNNVWTNLINLVKHYGVILEPSTSKFDKGATTFSCLYKEDEGPYYLYYSGSKDVNWGKSSIGLAISKDGFKFQRNNEPILSHGQISLTPAVFKAHNRYWMAFAYVPIFGRTRRLGIAVSDDPLGKWEVLKELIKPEENWEGIGIDIGPSVISMGQNEFLIYYSNIPNFQPNKPIEPRRIGILNLKISGPKNVESRRWEGNPLNNLNGNKMTWNESLFCPGFFSRGEKKYLLSSASNYSIGFPYQQHIGIIEDTSPFFRNPSINKTLIDGPKEKQLILPSIKSEIALDTPSPLIVDDKLWIYYAAMDRNDKIWKTALSLYSLDSE